MVRCVALRRRLGTSHGHCPPSRWKNHTRIFNLISIGIYYDIGLMMMMLTGFNSGLLPCLSVEDDVLFDFTFHLPIYICYDTRCSLNSHTHTPVRCTFGHST